MKVNNNHKFKTTPAEKLMGMTLNGKWKVIERVEKSPDGTGGFFSIGYIVKSDDGEKAYLKVLDYFRAFEVQDATDIIKAMTDAYKHERDLCRRCNQHNLSHIIKILEDGEIRNIDGDRESYVPYIILELGEEDIRTRLDLSKQFDVAWSLRCLHNIATGLHQLHGIDVAHQDLKPSNVIVFKNDYSKITDLGCASDKNNISPRDIWEIAGDRTYAPPELLYGFQLSDWRSRRLGCDFYLLGSMIVFLFMRSTMNTLIFTRMSKIHRPENWAESYINALPYITDAFGSAVNRFSREVPEIFPGFREELKTIVKQLCEPDPMKRGDPIQKLGSRNPYSLYRYISKFDRLAKKVEKILTTG